MKISDLKQDFSTMERLLREEILLQSRNKGASAPHVRELKIRLAAILIKDCCEKACKTKDSYENDLRIIEAKEILLERHAIEPENLYIISSLIDIASLQSNMSEVKKLLELKIRINPRDTKSEKKLLKVNKKLENLNQNCNSKGKDKFRVEDFSTNTYESDRNISPLRKYKSNLISAINAGNRKATLEALNKIAEDISLNPIEKKTILQMINLAQSNKQRSQIILKSKAHELDVTI